MDTLHYFRSYKDYFWQWEEGGEVVAIPKGSTICYREQLVSILTQLSNYGLPSLGSVILVLHALNPEPEEIYPFLEKAVKEQPSMVKSTLHVLKLIASLPPQYKKGIGKMELLRALFKGAHRNIGLETSTAIVNEFRQIRFNGEIYTQKAALHKHTLYNDLRPLSMLADKFQSVEDIKRAISGLPDAAATEIDLEPEEIPEPDKPKDFVEELMDHASTFPVGSLVRRIWSGLNIPFHNVIPSQQPMGGVSDITNKGDFHRLLTSEFAHDDVTFLSRLANNEALYINREVPPQSNEKERVILIDVSIRNWGTPKTIAYALLVAIAKHPKTDIPCSAYVVGDTYRQISFDSVDDIIAAMQELEGCMHPGKGIRKFMDDFRRKKNMELLVITNPETLKMPGLAVAVQDDLPLFRFWLVADQEGEIDVYKNQKNSRKHHQHFKLPLEELWSQRRPSRKYTEQKGQLPESDFPILFPGNTIPRRVLVAPDDTVFVVAKDRCVYRVVLMDPSPGSGNQRKGWERASERLSDIFSKVAIGQNPEGQYVLLIQSTKKGRGFLYNLNTREQKEFPFSPNYYHQFEDFIFRKGVFQLRSRRHIYSVSPEGETGYQLIEPLLAEELKRFESDYSAHKANVAAIERRMYGGENYLAKVNSMGISPLGYLVANRHELRMINNVLRWQPTAPMRLRYTATQSEGNKFSFGPRYTITNTGSGMLLLADSLGEKLYIPLALNQPLALASETGFAGNLYYKRDGMLQQPNIELQLFWDRHFKEFIKSVNA